MAEQMEKMERLFDWIDQTTKIIESEESVPYLEALIASSGLLFDPELPENMKSTYEKSLVNQLESIDLHDFSMEERRKAMQIAILKGMKGATQQHHYVTPDTIGILIGYLIEKFMEGKSNFRMFDPAVGTANFLLAVLNQLTNKQVEAFGSEVDPTLMRLAYNHTNLQEREIEYFHQDSLKPILLEPVDVVLSDLPVGYYPDDDNAQGFQLKAEEGHSLAHHLFIEQSLTYTKPGGYLFFLVPNFLFEMDKDKKLNQFLAEEAYINGVLELPTSLFKEEKQGKSILILQKKGNEAKKPRKVMLAQLPSFKDAQGMNRTIDQINEWFANDR